VDTLIDWDVCWTGSASSRRRFFEVICGTGVEGAEVSRTNGGPELLVFLSAGSTFYDAD